MTTRDRTVIIVVGVIVAIVASWLLVIGPKRSEASKLGSEVSAAESRVASAESTLVQDQAARASFARAYAEIARLGEAVPADDDVPSMLYQLQSAASRAHVDFRALTLQAQSGSSTPATTTPPAAGSKSGSTTSPASTAAASSAAAATSDASLPPGAAVGPAGFPTEDFTLTFQGNFFHLSDFLKRLEAFVRLTNRQVFVSGRLITLNAITLGPGGGGFPTMDASISATTYLVPAAQGLTAGATAGGPGSPTSTVSGSANPSAVAPATVTP
jgi:hypothetical protein